MVQKNKEWAKESTFEPQQIIVKETIETENNSNEESEEKQTPTDEDYALMKKVYETMTKDKIYKDLDLSLDTLAKQIDINRNYLSKAINRTTNKNFNSFINEYRVKEAIKILTDEKSNIISIDGIALEVGFNNRTSFYQSFKKITGLSPSDFRNGKNK